MLLNYLKSAYRNLKKTRVYSFINIFGLTLGMTICLLLLSYINYEKSYDAFHRNAARIYRLRYERTDSKGDAVRFASCTPPAGALLREQFEEIEKVARVFFYQASISYENTKFYENRLFFTDPEFAEIFDFNFLSGDPIKDLAQPGNAFLSVSTAIKYFGETDPIGKIISIDKKEDYQIVGLFEDAPHNSHIKMDFLLPLENIAQRYGDSYMLEWGHTGMYTYLLMREDAHIETFQAKLSPWIKEHVPWLEQYQMKIELPMQPLRDIHLTSHFMQEYETNGSLAAVSYLRIIAFFIILMAWVNYVNLSTARSLTRSKEVGMRKAIGASRRQLAIQFLVEMILINLIVLILTMLLLEAARPFFNNLTKMPIGMHVWQQRWFWPMTMALFFIGMLLSGLYPVVVLSSFKPVDVFRASTSSVVKGLNLRKVLITFQFVMALVLLASTCTIYDQISFMRQQDLGFDINQVLVFKSPRVRPEDTDARFKSFHAALRKNDNILKTCHVTEVPGKQLYWDNGGIKKAGADDSEGKNYQIVGMDYEFVDVFQVRFVAGRNFSREFTTDNEGLILNETAVAWMGFESSEQAIGQLVDYWGNIYTIIGVMKDYHQQSPKAAYEPTIYRLLPTGRDVRGQFAVKMRTSNSRDIVNFVEKTFTEFFPGNPFEHFFLDDYFHQQYQSDELFGHVFGLFSILAIFITAFGILGMSAYNIARRTKEIGIRKVLGASIVKILYLLSKEYLKWVIVSSMIAWPIAWYVMHLWLSGFASRIKIGAWSFAASTSIALVIALVTVSIQAWRTAVANPVETLRYE
ncbi:ABC transporter permease [candidate division KSB1 bacterium]|nr:ABC transporter permease [candidate division KSB1 bacterium]RQW07817.1 MAG: ABC transporter permease [candidate division KSB1 bacterium]